MSMETGVSQKPDTDGSNLVINADNFRLLAEHLPSLCWIAGADGFIFWYNRRWHEYCGTTPQEMEGWGWQSVHDPDLLPSIMERWQGSIASGERFEMVFPLRGTDGIFRPFLTKVEPVRDDSGAVRRWVGTNVEISAQHSAEQALRQSNTELMTLAAEREATLRQLQEGVIVTDEVGKITFVNEAAERLHGVAALAVTPDEYTKSYGLFTVDGEPHPLEDLPIYRALTNRETVVGARWIIRRPDGTEVLALGNAGPVYTDDGALIGAVLTICDDTERHASEQQLAQGVRTQELLIAELNHRVKNAFSVVKSIVSQSLRRHEVAADIQQRIDERLQAYADAHGRLMRGQWDQASLHDLAEEILGHHAREGRVTIKGPPVILPARQAIAFSMALYELMTNAFKHGSLSKPGGQVEFAWGIDGIDEPRLSVSWVERNGPPAIPPDTKGFGTFIIDRALATEMHGKVNMNFGPEGYRWMLEAPAPPSKDGGEPV